MDDISAITSTNNLTLGGNTPVSSDFKFYVPVPATEADDQTMSFGDFLDMINPLQHIPLVSSAYRSITGESINPAARIAGDALYGGILGVASAGIATLGAIVDEAFAANNDGKGVASTVVAALFGDDKTDASAQTQIADATPQAAAPVTAVETQTDTAPAAPQTVAQQSVQQTAQAPAQMADKTLPLDRTKPAYGGVMDTSTIQSAQQNQSLALALAGNNGIIKAQHALAGSRFMTSNPIPGSTAATDNSAPTNPTQNMILERAAALPSSTPAANSETVPTASAAATPNPNMQPTVQTQAALQGLLNDLKSIKGLDQYRNAAQNTPVPGSRINTVN